MQAPVDPSTVLWWHHSILEWATWLFAWLQPLLSQAPDLPVRTTMKQTQNYTAVCRPSLFHRMLDAINTYVPTYDNCLSAHHFCNKSVLGLWRQLAWRRSPGSWWRKMSRLPGPQLSAIHVPLDPVSVRPIRPDQTRQMEARDLNGLEGQRPLGS